MPPTLFTAIAQHTMEKRATLMRKLLTRAWTELFPGKEIPDEETMKQTLAPDIVQSEGLSQIEPSSEKSPAQTTPAATETRKPTSSTPVPAEPTIPPESPPVRAAAPQTPELPPVPSPTPEAPTTPTLAELPSTSDGEPLSPVLAAAVRETLRPD